MRLSHVLSNLLIVLTIGFIASATAAGSPLAAGNAGIIQGVLKHEARDKGNVKLLLIAPFDEQRLVVADPTRWTALAKARPGDMIKYRADDPTEPHQLTGVYEIDRPVPRLARLGAMAASLAAICLFAAAMARGSPLKFLIGVDNRYSNSQTQMALWFTALATVYLSSIFLRLLYLGGNYIGGIAIPKHLLVLTGLSAFSFGGAKVVTTQKVKNAIKEGSGMPKPPAARPNLLTDLVQNDKNQADLGDLEMIAIVLAAVGIFLLAAFHFLGDLNMTQHVILPDVDTTLLASFGIGHGAYLFKKAALNVGEG